MRTGTNAIKNGQIYRDANGREYNAQPVVIIDINVSFVQAIELLIKLGLAAIPAGIILGIVYFIIGGILAAVFGLSLTSLFPHY